MLHGMARLPIVATSSSYSVPMNASSATPRVRALAAAIREARRMSLSTGLLEYERTATSIFEWTAAAIHGTLQTSEYADAIFSHGRLSRKEIETPAQGSPRSPVDSDRGKVRDELRAP
ncbi:Scr1 family TA system antitoxin-like transcriptional regulator [Amycolatopsis sp. H20-H5]|uniref:Scr1 family TA system antitoxin-like transcriptional regulator n=1 Tax=Amycolatopsis sp. H20-H5 TaxID=3046309 RepID=UPI003FA34707